MVPATLKLNIQKGQCIITSKGVLRSTDCCLSVTSHGQN